MGIEHLLLSPYGIIQIVEFPFEMGSVVRTCHHGTGTPVYTTTPWAGLTETIGHTYNYYLKSITTS